MEIHKFEKLWFGVSMLLIVGWITTVVYGAVGPGIAMVGDGGNTVTADDPTASEQMREPGVYCSDDLSACDVYVLTRQFAFQPGTTDPIVVPAGAEVTFHITSTDVIHGFQLVGTNVNVMTVPGQLTEPTVVFAEPATYGIVCNEYCGSGHHTMEGQLRVVPADEYDGGDDE